jgi:hypothetical protein
MDDINLPSALILVWDVKRAIEKNISLQNGINLFIQRKLVDSFSDSFKNWYLNKEKRQVVFETQFNSFHKAIIHLLEHGLNGQPIYEQLRALELEIIDQCESCIQEHTARLPLIMQIPLLFLIFPAICVLLLVPTLAQLSF